MATDTMTSPLSMISHVVSEAEPPLVTGAALPDGLMDAGDNRSSSLSELGERGGRDEPGNDPYEGSDAIDTEAETERLEDSPQKIRKHQNLVHGQPHHVRGNQQSPSTSPILSPLDTGMGLQSGVDRVGPTSETSSLSDSGEGIDREQSMSPVSPKKRKRSSFEDDGISDTEPLLEHSTRATKIFRSTSAGVLVEETWPDESADDDDDDQEGIVTDTAILPICEAGPTSQENTLSKQEYRTGRRKVKKLSDSDMNVEDTGIGRAEISKTQEENTDKNSSNEGEDDNGDSGDAPGMDNAAKTEEGVIQKRTALDSLNAIEKCFATLRDKLFDERLAQCNEELSMLESSIPTHPELLAMKEVIDQRRDQKINYERTLLKYKLQTLQRESIANKAQAHAQYMQTARDLRDLHIEKLNKESYKLQRERRNVDGDVPDYTLMYNPKRSQQIKQQTAYNTEVCILSGVAKYVGFPAAPRIACARPKEIEDDLRNMGIPQNTKAIHNQPPMLRAASTFSQQRSRADEQFLEQNPWANPQHPSHHQQRQHLHRQISALSRAETPHTTPAAQRRIVDLTEPHGSASTIPDNPSDPNSSIAATPSTAEPAPATLTHLSNKIVEPTPSKVPGGPLEATPSSLALFESSADKGKALQTAKTEQSTSPALQRHTSHGNKSSHSLPKPLPFMHTGGSSSTPAPRTSTPGRYNLIKAEDPAHGARHASMPRYHTPPVTTVSSGLTSRFAI